MPEYREAIQAAREATHTKPAWQVCDGKDSKILNPTDTSQEAIDVFTQRRGSNGQVDGIGWWQCANGYTAIALRDRWSGDLTNYTLLCEASRQCEEAKTNFINVFNDDTLWWGLCCLHTYSIKGDHWFLDRAKAIWKHIKKGVCQRGKVKFEDQDMEGAVYWTSRENEGHINSISTGLFAELSVRLALLRDDTRKDQQNQLIALFSHTDPSREDYIEAARSSLGWILRCRYRPVAGIVLDHIRLKQKKRVDWTFTYNTGVVLGTCALLYEATREEEYMLLACHMAQKAVTHKGWVEDNGVLTEAKAYGRGTHDPMKDNDAVGFKSVLVRQLCTLYEVVKKTKCNLPKATETAELIGSFITINFGAQLESNTDGRGTYGPWWSAREPFEYPTSHSQMAVLDVLAAATLVTRLR